MIRFLFVYKIHSGFVDEQLHIDASKIIRFRDIVSHHYEMMDHAIIFNICTTNIPELHNAIRKFREKRN